MRKLIYALVVTVLLVSFGLGCAPAAPAGPIVWRFWDDSPVKVHPLVSEVTIPFTEEVAEKSGGRLIINVYLSGELGYKGNEELRILQAGAVESGHISAGWNAGDMPALGVFELPTLFENQAAFVKGYEATEDIWKRELAKWDIIPIGVAMVDEMITYSNKPLTGLEDFKGLKIRAYYAELSDLMAALGASPVFIPFPEQYSALQRGVIDATITGGSTGVSLKFWEVLDNVMVGIGYAYAPHLVAVSKKHFEALPKDLQQIVLDAGKKMGQRSVQVHLSVQENAWKRLEAEGMTMTRVSPADRAKIVKFAEEQVWSKWLEGAGPLGEELLEAILKATR